ncbi:hypothetical protein ONE63_006537 [Megalurothrips usitatus]|uniref:2-oxo-4-hydroxy-4-carboxy-5-ureidoimidazoline decarboxylase n=1 Tax=Megalurothrips usitatus TaxID=439358 RepID=A0AAV7XXN9_9NEOP|nr:hypothetical protein ONE63_006537 [Megalurothrips usitatus]
MPTATEPSAPKAAAKPKPAPKKPAADGAEKPQPAEKKPTENKKRTTEKKRTTSGSEKKTASGSEKKAASGGEKKAAPGGEKKRTTSGGERKRTTSGGEKKHPAARPARKVEEVADEPAPEPVFVPKLPVTLPALNELAWASCAKVLENLLDLTPSLGAALAHRRPFKSAQHLVDELNLTLDGLPPSYIEAFLKRFSELALVPKSKLTKEHKCCVGLDKLTDEQRAELTPLYTEYREKFGFPFVLCAREAKAAELGMRLRSHLQATKDQELESGRKEAKKIARLRLLEVVAA